VGTTDARGAAPDVDVALLLTLTLTPFDFALAPIPALVIPNARRRARACPERSRREPAVRQQRHNSRSDSRPGCPSSEARPGDKYCRAGALARFFPRARHPMRPPRSKSWP